MDVVVRGRNVEVPEHFRQHVAEKIERASETYGSLGVAFTLLFWLFVISRVIVASAILNAAVALERRPDQEAVLHA